MKIWQDNGSVVVEASLTLPVFAMLLLGLVSLLQIAAADMALRSAVSETVKTTAANMYPVKLLYAEAKQRFEESKAGKLWDSVSERVGQARSYAQTTEQFTEDYAAYIPEPLVSLIAAEKSYRTALEDETSEQTDEVKRAVAGKIAKEAVTPILVSFADTSLLKRDKLEVTSVEWPVLDDGERAWLGIEAKYEMKLALPFVTKTVVLKKKAVERCWIGSS